MMRTYILKLTGENLNSYIRGCVFGMVDVMTGVPDKIHPIRQYPNGHCEIRFIASEKQVENILAALDKRYSGIIKYEIVL